MLTACGVASVTFIYTAGFSELHFLREDAHCCLAICPFIKLFNINLLSEVISFRLESHFILLHHHWPCV
jgi:hypothetical protein